MYMYIVYDFMYNLECIIIVILPIQNFQPAACDDGLLELVGISGVMQLVSRLSLDVILVDNS